MKKTNKTQIALSASITLLLVVVALPLLAQYNPATDVRSFYTNTVKPIAETIFKAAILVGLASVVWMIISPSENNSMKKGLQTTIVVCIAITVISGIVRWADSINF